MPKRGRTPMRHEAVDKTVTWRVRFRQGRSDTSRTFYRESDANTFCAILNANPGSLGVTDALTWLKNRDDEAEVPSFGEFFETYVEQLTGVTPRTRADYRKMKARYLAELDALPLSLVTRGHVAAIVNRLEAQGLSAKTVKNAIHMLSSCMSLAADEGHIAKNPCRRVRLPKPGLGVTEARFLEPEEFKRLLAEIPEHYRPLIMFLVGTGCRWSEATALQPKHVSHERGTVRIEQAWKRVPGQGWALGPPKSPKSRRTVNAAVIALAAVNPLPKTKWLFTTPQGSVVRHNNFFNRIWAPAVIRAGLVDEDGKPTRLHDLRHTHASWLISEGTPLEAVQDQLGHESILTTRKVYGHLQPAVGVEVGRMASLTLARALGVDAVEAGGTVRGLRAIEGPHEPHDPDRLAVDGEAHC